MPIRSFGSVSKAELLKAFWVPCTLAGGGATVGETGYHSGVLVDAVGEYADIEIRVPPVAVTLLWFVVRIIPLAGAAQDMNFTFGYDVAQNHEPFNTHTGAVAATAFHCTANNMDFIETTAILAAVVGPDDICGLRVTYAAAGGGGIASNARVLGAWIEWA